MAPAAPPRGLDPASAEVQRAFAEIYRVRGWGDGESVSGPGSGVERTAAFRPTLASTLRALNARSLLDAGCGDLNWMPLLDAGLRRYVGVDVVPELIEALRARAAGPGREFLVADISRDPLPRADAILCRDCLVHLTLGDGVLAIENFKASGARYLVATTFVDRTTNDEIPTGHWRTLNLCAPPFSLPPPIALIDEHCTHTGGIWRDERLGVWDLRAL
ncbi:MAG: class I SAM-dependent methyltransferase [Chloroflexota bacterium]